MNNDVIVKFVRDDNKTFIIDDTDWGSLLIDGVDAAKYVIYSETNGTNDGSTITGEQIPSRDMEFCAEVMDTNQNEVLRWQAISFFQPKRLYKIFITYMGRTRWISGKISAFKCPAQYLGLKQKLNVFFLCPDPYMNSTDDFGHDIALQVPRWGFPYMDHPDFGVLVSAFAFSQYVNIDYDGDVDSYFTATMTFDNTVENPKIIKDNYFVRIKETFHPGDVVVIDFNEATITKNGKPILNKVDKKSNFTRIKFSPGVNTISYTADIGENDMHIRLQFYKKYLGV